MDGGPEHERLADGLTEDIITDLARYPDLAVIARNTAFTYENRSVRMADLGRELGVRYALEGSLQVAGDRVRVTAQLVDARDDRHLWAERFDRPLEDVFALQDELTRTIVHHVAGWRGELAAARNEVARRKPPESLEVYDLYRLTVELTDGLTKEKFAEAEPIIKRALELDPTFARAWWQLALIHQGYAAFGWADDPAPHMAAYADAIKRAVALDPHDPLIQVVAASAYIQENELERGLAAFERALALGPNNAEVLAYLAYMRPTKRPLRLAREDVEIARRALRLDPNPPPWFFGALGYAGYYAGLYEEAIEALQRMPSEISQKHLDLALSYAQLGRKEEAARSRAALLELIPHFSAQEIVKGDNMRPEAAEHFLDGARKAGLPL
jgi:adenylate cyclase